MKRLGKALLLVFGIWLVFVLVCPSRPSARGRAIVAAVRNEAHQIQGRELARSELDSEVAKLKLNWSLNRFAPETRFVSPTNWSVTLVPEKRKTYVNSHSLPYRILFLEFARMEYPDITFTSNDEGTTTKSTLSSAAAPSAAQSER